MSVPPKKKQPRAPRPVASRPSRDNPRRIAWRRLAVEMIVVFAGVFLAILAEAAWQERQERLRESDYLVQLRVEVARTEREIAQAIETETEVIANADALIQRLGAADPGPDDELTRRLSRVFRSSLFAPTSGTVGTLVTTGDLRLLTNSTVRSAVVDLYEQIDRHRRVASIQDGLLVAASQRVGTRVDLSALFAPDTAATPAVSDWRDLARSIEFRSEMFHVRNAAFNRLQALERLGEALSGLRDRLTVDQE